MDILTLRLEEDDISWTRGPELSVAASGGGGAVVDSSPALFSGFSLGAGYSRAVSSLGAGAGAWGWTTWPAHLDRARVAGVTLAVPSDMFHQC